MTLGRGLWLLVMVYTATARAESEGEALTLVRVGVDLYKAGNFAGARNALLEARNLAPDKPGPYRWLGLAEARLGRCGEAIDSLERFLKGIAAVDPRRPESETARDLCKATLVRSGGSLSVESEPAGAELRLERDDGPALGTTPYRSALLDAGIHLVFMRKSGFKTVSKSVKIATGELLRVRVDLAPENAPPIKNSAQVFSPARADSVVSVAPPPAPRPLPALPTPAQPLPAPAHSIEKVAAPTPSPLPPPSSIERTAPPVAAILAPLPASPSGHPIYRRWWVWTAVGAVVVAGVGVGLGFGLTPHNASQPQSDLGSMTVPF